jgi:hypothetical protein
MAWGCLDQIDRRRGECDLLARFQDFRVAAGLQAHIAFAEQAAGEDAGRSVDRQVFVAAVDGERDHGVQLFRVELDSVDLADRHAADLDRRHRTQLAEVGEAGLERVAVLAEAEAAVGRGDRQHQQRGQGQQQKGADGEFETGTTSAHERNPGDL